MTLAPNKIGNSTVGVAPTIGWELFSHDADVGIRGFGSTVAGRFAVHIEDTRLSGTLWGEPADAKRHAPVCEPKGATYTALRVAQDADGFWSASCVVDV